ncbi:hypothetical protein OSB04_019985 [Centaurea solstitialis]|uniref:Gag protein n=1 Tax=Centaurea solstitialis TaxID=347529 RepID=A0AA38W5H2_9ASTR|nr:hypothetical protein OSB04_019985 [Centaurea solstitialis]
MSFISKLYSVEERFFHERRWFSKLFMHVMEPKPVGECSEADKEIASLATRYKRLLIMAIPNDIFESLDSCETSMELWAELLRQLEGRLKTLKNNRAICINEYHDFKALEGESPRDTYSRFNTLLSKCRRFRVIRTSEENNALFIKRLGEEWMNLTIKDDSSEDEVSMKDMMKTLALITREYRKGGRSYDNGGKRDSFERRNERSYERKDERRGDDRRVEAQKNEREYQRTPQRVDDKKGGERSDGCYC